MTNAPIKTTPIFIAQRGSNMSADCTTNSLENGFTTCLELGQINQCISIAKHVSSTAFCIVTLTIWGGGVATPETSPFRSAPALVLLCISSLYRYFITHMEIDFTPQTLLSHIIIHSTSTDHQHVYRFYTCSEHIIVRYSLLVHGPLIVAKSMHSILIILRK